MELLEIRAPLVIWGCLTLGIRAVYMRQAGQRKAQEGASPINPHPMVLLSMTLWIALLVLFVIAPDVMTHARLMIYSPVPRTLQALGLTGLMAGLWFFVRAHRALGEFYGVTLFIKEAHRVIDVGPYAYIRHPMYATYMFWVATTLLFLPHYGTIVILLLAFIGFYRMAKGEERMLCSALGAPYEAYIKRTGMFLPRWPARKS